MPRLRRPSAGVPRCAVAAAVLAGLVLVSRPCPAPVLFLRDGRKMAGICRLSGKSVAVSRGLTTTYVPRASIERVELHPTEQRELRRLRDSLNLAGARGQYKLGKWR